MAILVMIASINVIFFNKLITQNTHAELACLTMKTSGAACDQNAALALSLHLWQEDLDCLDGTQKVNFQNLPHRV